MIRANMSFVVLAVVLLIMIPMKLVLGYLQKEPPEEIKKICDGKPTLKRNIP